MAKKSRRCAFCGGKATGGHKTIDGKYVLSCPECREEAINGKYGNENRRYSRLYVEDQKLNEGFADYGY